MSGLLDLTACSRIFEFSSFKFIVIEQFLYSRGRLRGGLAVWANEVLQDSGFHPAAHHLLLIRKLEQVCLGRIDRLMILMPPGSAKSTYASVIFPVWWFIQHPSSSIICASHSLQLAEHFSRRVRALIFAKRKDLGFGIKSDHRRAASWSTTTGGEFFSVGVQGSTAGRRADLVVIDDPIGSQADAENDRQRNHTWDWYRSDIVTRLRPGGRIVLIMTRWHPDDLGGRLLETASHEWDVLRLPALAEDNDPLGRDIGAPLWPEWESEEALNRKRNLIGERTWSALFQQQPQPVAGRLFKCEQIHAYETVDHGDTVVRAWDLAATEGNGRNDPDWTVGVKLARDVNGRFVVLDVARLRGTPREVEALIVDTARRDGQHVSISLPEDPGQAGKSQVSYLVRQLAGFRVMSSRESGSKLTRAMPLASQVESGNVSLIKADWNRTLLDELSSFPWGKKDDQVDALVRAFTVLSNQPRGTRSVSIPLLSR